VLLFAIVLAIDVLLGLVIRGGALAGLVGGNHGWHNVLAAAGLAWLVVVAFTGFHAGRTLRVMSTTVTSLGHRFGQAASSSPDWFWQADGDLLLTYSSAGVEGLLGYRPDEVVGHPLTDFVDGADRMRFDAIISTAVDHGRGWGPTEILWRHRSGSLVALIGDGSAIVGTHGKIIGFHGVRRATERSTRELPRLTHVRRLTQQVIDERLIRPALQPIIDLIDGSCSGAEALSRFPGDDRPPNAWFADAHEVHLGVELELAALDAALGALGELSPKAYLSFNASPSLVLDTRLAECIARSRVPLDRLVLEITEHTSIEHYTAVIEQLAPLRQRGLRIAVDDTGAGFASFRHVLQLKPDVIKLDRSLIEDIATDSARRALITSIVLLALELGAHVTAEGVEKPEELEVIRSLGADSAQGYLLGRPTTDRAEWRRWGERAWLSAIH
jgi:PAS domain S-box-containing protein